VKREKRLFSVLLVMLVCSMSVTEGLLMIQGRWREAIPLHLCSLSAIAAAALAVSRRQFLINFLWYLGMPGAALALVFPAPASSVCQTLLDSAYFATHALILLIPFCRMAYGMRPEKGKTMTMLLVLLGAAGFAAAVNKALGTNFLFLALPPAGTPLEAAFSLGYPLYWLTLFALMILCCLAMETAARKVFPQITK